LVISSPEYAHGVPGALKDALDWLVSTPALFEKPVVLLNAAPSGGMFAQESLAETLRTMGADVLDGSQLTPFVRERLHDGALPSDVANTLRRCMDVLARAIAADTHRDDGPR
jgi:NAD(P)H-dependent FMN reductase